MEIVAAIIGGFLAAGTGWFVQHRMEVSRVGRLRALLVQGISDDLTSSIALYDRLAEDWQRSKIVWFNIITELADSRHTFTNNRDSILLIEDRDLRTRIVEYYRKSHLHLLSLQNAQQRKYDILNQYTRSVQEYCLKNPDADEQTAQSLVANSMSRENQELAYWDEQLPSLVSGLERFKGEARELLRALPNPP